ncbi:hypothetical protein ARMGADRAFT_1031871 [Armillaria gallica]|uniref:Uncharacterized protein n=1 Tax=Armillaria gallica TaxID=47427 RepID=A0A2H3D7I6_ARMGA|nr:hypothetical protein ARMGADRAFT_1031871 [Armillaria gallica]
MPTNDPPPNHDQEWMEEQREEQMPPFVFPSSWRDPCMLSSVSVVDSPHANGAEFVPEGPEQEQLVACLQPNLGNFKGSAFHHVNLLANLDPSQLTVITEDVGDYTLGIVFNGGRKFTEMAKPKPWETLNTIFIPLTGSDGSFKAYQGLPDKYQEDKLGPPVIVILELTSVMRDVLLCQRILTIDDSLTLHVVLVNWDHLSWAAWILKANEPIIMSTENEIAAIGACLRYIIIKNLWEDKEVQKMIYRATRNRQDPIPRVVFKALVDSYVEYRGTKEIKYWVFYLNPPSLATTAEEWNQLHAHIRKKMICNSNISITPALSKVGNQYCTICKLDSHPTFDCSFTRDNAVFQGPTKPIVGGNFEDRQMNSSRGNIRGGRGRGGCLGWNKSNRALPEQYTDRTVMASTGTRGGSNPATDYGLTEDGAKWEGGEIPSQGDQQAVCDPEGSRIDPGMQNASRPQNVEQPSREAGPRMGQTSQEIYTQEREAASTYMLEMIDRQMSQMQRTQLQARIIAGVHQPNYRQMNDHE